MPYIFQTQRLVAREKITDMNAILQGKVSRAIAFIVGVTLGKSFQSADEYTKCNLLEFELFKLNSNVRKKAICSSKLIDF